MKRTCCVPADSESPRPHMPCHPARALAARPSLSFHMTDFNAMAAVLEQRFREGAGQSWEASDFEALAHGVFRNQFEHCDPYRALCVRRGVTPETVSAWADIPAVPATAFKYFDFVSHPGGEVEKVFLTSGTTRGSEGRGRHSVPRLKLYKASCMDPFRRALVPDVQEIDVLSLIPSSEAAPNSSLSFMVEVVAGRFGSTMEWLVDGRGRWVDDVEARFSRVRRQGGPALVLGTALSFIHLKERYGDLDLSLPAGSRVMETGGFKGAGRDITRAELHRWIVASLGVAPEAVVNEYGMTELLSQLYEPVLHEGLAATGAHVAPPWLAVRALDPTTLREAAEGEPGILCFFDLANLGSVSHVLTEDVGAIRDGRVHLRGRTEGAEPRGCSRAMDDLMRAAVRE